MDGASATHRAGAAARHLFRTNLPPSKVEQSYPNAFYADSHGGHYYGKDGFDALTPAKSILVSRPDVAIEHLFPPYTSEKVQEPNQWFAYSKATLAQQPFNKGRTNERGGLTDLHLSTVLFD
jgi:hypothetical protein